MTTPPPLRNVPLSDEELDRVEVFLRSIRNGRALTLEGLDGLFCALVAGPELVMPSEYLPAVWGGELSDENAFESEAAAQAMIGLMMRHWNAIGAEFERDGMYAPLFDAPDERGVPGRLWAKGFMLGVGMRHQAWSRLMTDQNEGQLFTIAVVAGAVDPTFPREPLTAEHAEELRVMMAAGAGRAYRYYAAQRRASARAARDARTVRREERKVGRNEPCPCGSGRKYKQCCGRGHDGPPTVH